MLRELQREADVSFRQVVDGNRWTWRLTRALQKCKNDCGSCHKGQPLPAGPHSD